MKNNNHYKTMLALLLSAALLAACSSTEELTSNEGSSSAAPTAAAQTNESAASSGATAQGTAAAPEKAVYEEEDLDADWSDEKATNLDLSTQEGPVKITAAGTYVVSGKLKNGGMIVEVSKEDKVRLVLSGAEIHNENGSAIEIIEGEKVFITLQEGTQNIVTDGASYEDTAEDAANSAIYSKADLVVNGIGSLTVKGSYKDGLTSRDDLKLVSGTITVHAADDGIIGRDLLTVKGGTLQIEAGGDGMKSTNDKEEGRGNIAIEGGSFRISAGSDGLQSAVSIRIDGGTFDITSGGGSANGQVKAQEQMPRGDRFGGAAVQQNTAIQTAGMEAEAASTKALKAAQAIVITDGTLGLNAADDAVHSNNSIDISGGKLTISSGDDGIHADASILIQGGTIDITKSYEGIESAVVTIADGDIRVISSDDGINIAGGMDGSSLGGRPGQNQFASTGNNKLVITGGSVTVDASGDGLDANGSIEMSGGTVVVNGPQSNNNAALDYDGAFLLSGGSLMAAGSAGMAMAPSDNSAQASILMSFSTTQAAGTAVRVEDASGKAIAAVTPLKSFQTLIISSPELKIGETYKLIAGDSSAEFKPSSSVTWLNESGVTEAQTGRGGPGGGGGDRQRPAGQAPMQP